MDTEGQIKAIEKLLDEDYGFDQYAMLSMYREGVFATGRPKYIVRYGEDVDDNATCTEMLFDTALEAAKFFVNYKIQHAL